MNRKTAFEWGYFCKSFFFKFKVMFAYFPVLFFTSLMAILLSFGDGNAIIFIYIVFGLSILLKIYFMSSPIVHLQMFAHTPIMWIFQLVDVLLGVIVIVFTGIIFELVSISIILIYTLYSAYNLTKTLQKMGTTSDELIMKTIKRLEEIQDEIELEKEKQQKLNDDEE